VLGSLKLQLDWTAAAAETVRRKRWTFVDAMHYAKDLGEFKVNPITSNSLKRNQRSLRKLTPVWSPTPNRLAPC
jgi:hypothetical protein